MNYEKIFEEYCESNSRPDKINIIERACLEAQLEVLNKILDVPIHSRLDEVVDKAEEIEAKLKAMKP